MTSDRESEEMHRLQPCMIRVATGRSLLLPLLWKATRAAIIGGWKIGMVSVNDVVLSFMPKQCGGMDRVVLKLQGLRR